MLLIVLSIKLCCLHRILCNSDSYQTSKIVGDSHRDTFHTMKLFFGEKKRKKNSIEKRLIKGKSGKKRKKEIMDRRIK